MENPGHGFTPYQTLGKAQNMKERLIALLTL